MVAIMAKPVEQAAYGDPKRDDSRLGTHDDLVVLAKTQAGALGKLYELYYDRIFRFCVHRLFNRTTAEDVTSSVFLTVARTMRDFKGRTEQDFRSWIYTIAANQANAHIRKTMRRKRLMNNVQDRRWAGEEDSDGATGSEAAQWSRLDWPTLYAAIQELKPEHQTILTLRFFENMDYDEIGRVVDARPATVRVTLHRTLRRLQEVLQGDLGGEA
jgi:RNA polymerase sigma-70 factor (ECF subfamily)